MSAPIIVMTEEQVRALVSSAVAETVKAHTGDAVLDEDECAELLKVSKVTLRRYTKTRGLPAHPLSERELRFMRSEVLNWVSSQKLRLVDGDSN